MPRTKKARKTPGATKKPRAMDLPVLADKRWELYKHYPVRLGRQRPCGVHETYRKLNPDALSAAIVPIYMRLGDFLDHPERYPTDTMVHFSTPLSRMVELLRDGKLDPRQFPEMFPNPQVVMPDQPPHECPDGVRCWSCEAARRGMAFMPGRELHESLTRVALAHVTERYDRYVTEAIRDEAKLAGAPPFPFQPQTVVLPKFMPESLVGQQLAQMVIDYESDEDGEAEQEVVWPLPSHSLDLQGEEVPLPLYDVCTGTSSFEL